MHGGRTFWIQVARFAAAAGAMLLAVGVARADDAARTPNALGVDSIGITVGDIERAVEFYAEVLSFRVVGEREVAGDAYEHLFGVFGMRARIVRMALGGEAIELIEFLAPQGRPLPADSRSNDGWFQHVAIIVSDMDRAYAGLREHRVRHASSGPQTLPDWNPNAGGIRAFYFRDPDGNHLEILEFPPGKGAARWQAEDRLFLGIDHTAIVVADTDASLGFYRDALGMTVAGASENYGPEQERLNNVFGARLRITALVGAVGGPGVELLEYLAPRTGRPMPQDTQANDLWHWQINFAASAPLDIAAAARVRGYRYVSPGVVVLPAEDGPTTAAGSAAADSAAVHATRTEGLMLRDPDGHAAYFGRPY